MGPIGSATLAPALNLGLLALATWCSLKFFLSRTLPMPLWQDLLLLGQMLLLPALSSTLQKQPQPGHGSLGRPFAPVRADLAGAAIAAGHGQRLGSGACAGLTLKPKMAATLRPAVGRRPRFTPTLLLVCGLGLLAGAAAAALTGVAAIELGLALGLLLPLSLLALGLQYLLSFAQDRLEAEKEHAQFEHRMQERVTEMERNFGAAGGAASRAGHRARAQAHCRRPARRSRPPSC